MDPLKRRKIQLFLKRFNEIRKLRAHNPAILELTQNCLSAPPLLCDAGGTPLDSETVGNQDFCKAQRIFFFIFFFLFSSFFPLLFQIVNQFFSLKVTQKENNQLPVATKRP